MKNRDFPIKREGSYFPSSHRNQAGFSLIETLSVMALIAVFSSVTFLYLNATQDLYKADEQALSIIDVMQEARQRSLTQRETMRVEIDVTDNVVRLIDENDPDSIDDDNELRSVPLLDPSEVRVDERASQIGNNPPEEFPVPTAKFKRSIYPPSQNHDVCTIRFLNNGRVVDQGNNGVGNGAVNTGLTLHVWSPRKDNSNKANIARGITIIGSTGSIRLWEHDPSLKGAVKWKDTRRTSVFGGQARGKNSNSN